MNLKTLRALCAAAIALATATTASALPITATDAFGYTLSGIGHQLRDVSTTGTAAFTSYVDDTIGGPVNIGFDFSFYGNQYAQLYIGSNGFVTFSPNQSQGCCNGGILPGTPDPANLIAGWFTDLVSNAGAVRYQTVGDLGARAFVVGYYNNSNYGGASGNTFEIVLHEGSNDIELQYLRTAADGHMRTVGIEDSTGSIGLQALYDNSTVLNRQGLCFSSGGTNCTLTVETVPEPASIALVGVCLAGLIVVTRRKRS